jgi:hypothetical protein
LSALALAALLAQCRREPHPDASAGNGPALAAKLIAAADAELPDLAGRATYEILKAASTEDLAGVLDHWLREPASRAGSTAFRHALRHFAASAPQEASAWLRQKARNHGRLRNGIGEVLPVLALKAPAAMPALAADMPTAPLQMAVWRAFAAGHPAQALSAWRQAGKVPEPDPSEESPEESSFSELLRAAIQSDPAAVAAWMAAQPDAAALMARHRSLLVSAWVFKDAPAALQWGMNAPASTGIVPTTWAEDCQRNVPTQRTDWMRQMAAMLPPGRVRSMLLENAARFDGRKDRPAAANWVSQLTLPADIEAARLGLKKADEVALDSGFIMPAPTDPIVSYVTERSVLGLPETFAWASRLDAAGMRQRALFAAARLWASRDRRAAESAAAALTRQDDRAAAEAGLNAGP